METFSVDFDQLARRLAGEVVTDEPAVHRGLRSSFAPQLAYGRHRGPYRDHSRQAAVAICLYPDEATGDWLIPLTRRPTTLRHHAGQICFPGGRIESGETAYEAALREFEEELGVSPDVLFRGRPLPKQFVYASDNVVHPEVLVIAPPVSKWQPDPGEVDEVIEIPLSQLLDPHPQRIVTQSRPLRKTPFSSEIVGEIKFCAPAYQCADRAIWGATAILLSLLAQRLHPQNAFAA